MHDGRCNGEMEGCCDTDQADRETDVGGDEATESERLGERNGEKGDRTDTGR